ncbi:MAG: T9SS type A sorting domain-containing protein [Bacteroidia bacterium]|nr:T9SS type A sorting domain-containing protein [Bacteroidia bacterium]
MIVSSAPSYSQINYTMQFDGGLSYVEVGHNSNLNIAEDQTVELWVRPDTSRQMILLRKGWCNYSRDGYSLAVVNGRVKWVWATNGNCDYNGHVQSMDSVIPNGKCSHIAVVHTKDTVRIYVNGKRVRTELISGRFSKINLNNEKLTIGSYRFKGGSYGVSAKGLIDEVRIWNEARSASKIAGSRFTRLSGKDSNLIAYYPMEDSIVGSNKKVTNASYLGNVLDGLTVSNNNWPRRDTSCVDLIEDSCWYYEKVVFTDHREVCGSLKWTDGKTYFQNTKTPKDTLVSQYGCDSIIQLDLTVYRSAFAFDTVYACDEYTWQDGVTYTSSNSSAHYILRTDKGCDSVVFLKLFLSKTIHTTDSVSACDSFTWIDGKTYFASTQLPSFRYSSTDDCDSIVHLNLRLNKTKHGFDTIQSCDSFTWINGRTYFESTDTATAVVTASSGCDSLVLLNLQIYKSSNLTENKVECDSFRWTDDKLYTQSGIYQKKLLSSTGCDSIQTLNLTLHHSSSYTDVRQTCDSITWIDGITYSISTSSPSFLLTNRNGCDSTVYLNLSILEKSFDTIAVTRCDSIATYRGLTYRAGNHQILDTFVNRFGCDSSVLTNLSVVALNQEISRLNDTLLAQETMSSYQWYNCDRNEIIPGATERAFVPNTSARYAVILSKSGCTDTSQCILFREDTCCSGIWIEIFPNPFDSYLKLRIHGDHQPLMVKMELFNAIGQRVAFKEERVSKEMTLTPYALAHGVYLLKVSFANRVKAYKVIHAIRN